MLVEVTGFYVGYSKGYITLSDVDVKGCHYSRLCIKSNKLEQPVGSRVKLTLRMSI